MVITNSLPKKTGFEERLDAVEQVAQDVVDLVKPATTSSAGIVKPDGSTITVDADGTIHGAPQDSDLTFETRQAYEAWAASSEYDPEATCFIEEDSALMASSVGFDDSQADLGASNIQTAVEKIASDLVASDNLKFRFATDGEGNYGYLKADDSFVPFKSGSGELHGAVISGSTADSTLFGQTVSLTKNSETVQTTTVNEDGTFSFIDIEEVGTYVISSTDTEGIYCSSTTTINSDQIINKTVISITLILEYVAILGTTEEATLIGKAANLYKNSSIIKSVTISDSGAFGFKITEPGDYEIKATDGSKEASSSFTITSSEIQNRTTKSINLSFLAIVTFAAGTDEQIAAMIAAHYNGDINISDYWSVGDTRNVTLSAMGDSSIVNSRGVTETHTAQTVQWTIIDFNHDDLVTPINGKTKAAITINQKDCLKLETNSTFQYENSTADASLGSMNSYSGTHTNAGGWRDCARRTWCNTSYKNALPTALKNAIKTVNKKTSAGSQSSTIYTTQDDVFLLSEIEIFGSTTYSFAGEGSQYSYFTTTSNRYKMPKWSSADQQSAIWWERSPLSSNSTNFCSVNLDGSAVNSGAGSSVGLAPACCL